MAAPAGRRPISPCGNCRKCCRRRFSWLLPASRTARPAGGINPVNRAGWRPIGRNAGSELVAEPGADRVDAGIDRGCEADIFPLRAQEQAADQTDVDAE